MKTTNLWPGVSLRNNTGRRILIQWRTLPDGTKMALLMGEGKTALSGEQEIGFFGAIASAAPALFNVAKKLAPGLMKKAGDFAGKVLPGGAAKLLQQAVAPAAAQAQKQIAQAGQIPSKVLAPPVVIKPPPSRVKHLPAGTPIPKGWIQVKPVTRVEDGSFID